MKLLADENFPRPTVVFISRQGHDILSARTGAPGLTDRALIERAEADGRLILTLDKDFWQLALQRRAPLENSGIILFRVFRPTPENLQPLVEMALGAKISWVGHVAIVTKTGIEMFPTHRLPPTRSIHPPATPT